MRSLFFQELVDAGCGTTTFAHGEDHGCSAEHDVTTGVDLFHESLVGGSIFEKDVTLLVDGEFRSGVADKRVGTVTDSNEHGVAFDFEACTFALPSAIGEVMILSAPSLKTGTTYTVKTGVTVKDGTGTRFHNLYTTMPTISGGSSTITDFATSSSNMVYTDSKAGSGFGNFGGGPGGPGGFGGRQAFGNGEMPEPPEGFKGGRPDGNFQPPEGFEPSEGMEPPEGFKGGRPNGNFQPSEGMEPPEGFNKKQRGNKKQQNKQ